MPKQTTFRKQFGSLLKSHYDEFGLYMFITGQKVLAPSLHIKDCALAYLNYWGISEDMWPLESAIQAYYRLDEYGFKTNTNDKNS